MLIESDNSAVLKDVAVPLPTKQRNTTQQGDTFHCLSDWELPAGYDINTRIHYEVESQLAAIPARLRMDKANAREERKEIKKEKKD